MSDELKLKVAQLEGDLEEAYRDVNTLVKERDEARAALVVRTKERDAAIAALERPRDKAWRARTACCGCGAWRRCICYPPETQGGQR